MEARRRLDVGDRLVRPGAQPDLLGHRQSRSRSLRRRPRRRQPLHRLGRRARRRHRHAQVALPVHAARRPRLGRHAGAGARRDRRSTACARRRCCSPTATASTTRSIAPTASCSAWRPFVKTTWAETIAPNGRPNVQAEHRPDRERHRGLSRHHRRHQLPVAGLQSEDRSALRDRPRGVRDLLRLGAGVRRRASTYFGGAAQRTDRGFGAMRAIDPATGSVRWEFKYHTPSMAGVLSTESGLVFGGDMDGNVMAFDAGQRQEPVALPDRLGHLRRADDLHARRPAVGGDAVGDDAVRVRTP